MSTTYNGYTPNPDIDPVKLTITNNYVADPSYNPASRTTYGKHTNFVSTELVASSIGVPSGVVTINKWNQYSSIIINPQESVELTISIQEELDYYINTAKSIEWLTYAVDKSVESVESDTDTQSFSEKGSEVTTEDNSTEG